MPPWKNTSLWHKFNYSLNGLRVAFLAERAFRHETIASFLLVALSVALTKDISRIIIVFFLSLIPMAIELINSAVEMLIDNHVGTNWREDIRRTKDMLSGSVFLGLVMGYGGCLFVIFCR